jgi:hypothetical protein
MITPTIHEMPIRWEPPHQNINGTHGDLHKLNMKISIVGMGVKPIVDT